jgi:galactokinase/mevalonate kinase-like predicted kinase
MPTVKLANSLRQRIIKLAQLKRNMFNLDKKTNITDVIGNIPYRMAFAGGWIDQPFVSRHNPDPPGSMVVVSLEPTVPFMDRCGMGTSTRKVMLKIWGGHIPDRDPADLVREAYAAENQGCSAPSGSQDMAGIIYPGVNRLDYDFGHEGGYFPAHVESNANPEITRWLEKHIYMVPIAQRPSGYDPLEEQNLDPRWIQQLSQTGKDCFDAILARDARALGKSMNDCMDCWKNILPCTVRHRTISLDLMTILGYYQTRYCGAMYSGCGGGYLYVVAEECVPGSLQVKVRTA